MQEDSPIFPLYTEVTSKGISKFSLKDDGSRPEELTKGDIKELNLFMDKEIDNPTVPKQSLTTELIQIF